MYCSCRIRYFLSKKKLTISVLKKCEFLFSSLVTVSYQVVRGITSVWSGVKISLLFRSLFFATEKHVSTSPLNITEAFRPRYVITIHIFIQDTRFIWSFFWRNWNDIPCYQEQFPFFSTWLNVWFIRFFSLMSSLWFGLKQNSGNQHKSKEASFPYGWFNVLHRACDSVYIYIYIYIYIYKTVKNIALSTVDGYSLGLLTDNATKTLFF